MHFYRIKTYFIQSSYCFLWSWMFILKREAIYWRYQFKYIAARKMSTKSTLPMDVIRDCSPNRPKLMKVSDRHPKLILEQINQLRRSNELCDVCLRVGNSKIYAHKIVLCASSPYFRAMFTGELAESKQTEITIREIEDSAMEMLIDFCYTSKITIDEKSVQTLLPAACILQVLLNNFELYYLWFTEWVMFV